MQTLSHSQAAASGNFESTGATAGRVMRITTAREVTKRQKDLFDSALAALQYVDATPELQLQLLEAQINWLKSSRLFSAGSCWSLSSDVGIPITESSRLFSAGSCWSPILVYVQQCAEAVRAEIECEDSPTIEDLASLAGRVA